MAKKVHVTIFIPTINAGELFVKVLDAICSQSFKDYEIIVVDSGSSDDTVSRIKSFKSLVSLKLFEIKPSDFGHGKTRNLALKYAQGKIIVFISQDAIPRNNNWLDELIKPLDERVVACFSRQIPYEDAREVEKYFYSNYFGFKDIIKPNKNSRTIFNDIFFSNVSSAIKRDILQKIPFDEKIIMSEDQMFSKKVIEAGFKIKYCSKSGVTHSHNYGLIKTFKRYFDSAVSFTSIVGPGFREISRGGDHYILNEFKYFLLNKPWIIPYILLNDMVKIIATTLGVHHRTLPNWLKRRISGHSYYFK